MAEPMVIDGEGEAERKTDGSDQKKPSKRKRSLSDNPILNLSTEEKSARIDALREELGSLFSFYKELIGNNKENEKAKEELWSKSKSNADAAIAALMEESALPLRKLVSEIFEKVKGKFGNGDGSGFSSVASVKSKVLLIGQRIYYGLLNVDADLFEDDSESALWCWETKNLKLFPKYMRALLKTCRTYRERIKDRIIAVSAMITALEKSENSQNSQQDLVKASAKLSKTLNEADIRSIIGLAQETGAEEAAKGAKQEEKLSLKQLEKNKREEEKERRRKERELQREKLQNEKEKKRLQEDAEKEERRREKEESEMKKLLKRHQEEAEKDQRRKEKEEAELKKQLSLQKQASLMERFFKSSKTNSASQKDQFPSDAISDISPRRNKEIPDSVTLAMDSILSMNDGIKAEDIWKLHIISWRCLGRSIHSNRNMHWGVRQKPKTKLVPELKLTTNRGLARDDEMSIERLVDGWVDSGVDNRLHQTNSSSLLLNSPKHIRSKQLLQFDKSHRPAFYGVWPRKSQVVTARRPLAKDPELDYDNDSDEEWEEEEPGESLSDCDKDDEDESLDEVCSKGGDDDGSEDGFFVPDGYLSENEGVEVDTVNSEQLVEETRSSPISKEAQQSDDFCLLLRQQKYLHNLTEHALRKNQPLIISNLMHEKAPLLFADNLTGAEKLDQMCLQALSICAFPSGLSIEISIGDVGEEDEEVCTSNSKASTELASPAFVLESDLPEIVSIIQSCSHGMNKVVECLLEKFPSASKSQLRNKVREISDFVDNRWQVKKDILVKLGLAISPEKGSGRRKSIATFFSKRCLPPSKTTSPTETSGQSSQEPVVSTPPQKGSAHNH